MKVRASVWVTVFCAALAMASTVSAQEIVVLGAVTDATDAVLPGVTLTALHVDTGNTFVGVTDAAGGYRIGALRPGVYKITAELAGFTTAIREKVELLLGQRATLNFKMTLSTVQESVTVTGEAPLVDTSQSKLGGNVDPRQMQELPINGRAWLDLTMLAPGSRANSVAPDLSTPTQRLGPGGLGVEAQLILDGQQVTNMVVSIGVGQPQFARDSLAELEFVSNRFDVTHGRSMGLLVISATKAGTNRFGGSVSGYFRDDRFNAKDFIVNRVLPYSNQQVSATFGGPIKKDRVHFFGHYEYEREPQTITFTSVYPRFNAEGAAMPQAVKKVPKTGIRFDAQFSTNTRLMARGNRHSSTTPQELYSSGGAFIHPSAGGLRQYFSHEWFAVLTQVWGPEVVNELKGGYSRGENDADGYSPVFKDTPNIVLRGGYRIGKSAPAPQHIVQHGYQLRDDLTMVRTGRGRHEFKVGGEFIYLRTDWWPYTQNGSGTLDAQGGPVPANIEDLFPVRKHPATWNIAALSPVTRFWTQAIGNFYYKTPITDGAAWVQDNWAVGPRLTLNLGLRYDVSVGALGEDLTFPPFLPNPRPTEKLHFQPRLGFAYTLPDKQTVFRGGFGKYYGSVEPPRVLYITRQQAVVVVPNDGRPDFAINPFNGPAPSVTDVPTSARSVGVFDPDIRMPYSWQGSIGVQRQIGQTMAVEADYVSTKTPYDSVRRDANLSYNPATGANYPFADLSKRPYPNWSSVQTLYSDSWSTYRGLQTAFTKRLSRRWQGAATYTLAVFKDLTGAPTGPCVVSEVIGPCPAGFKVAPDLEGEYTYAVGDQRHRAVFNGIGLLPYGFQLSGLYFFGSGQRRDTTYGADLRARGPSSSNGRLRPDGTIVPRNNFVGLPLHRVDLRVLRQFSISRTVKVDGIFEVFNLFNHANYGNYVTTEISPLYGKPQFVPAVAYQPRMLQLGFRLVF